MINPVLIIGKKSDGIDFKINITNTPNLFVSYTTKAQLYEIFKTFFLQLSQQHSSNDVRISFALTDKTATKVLKYYRDDFYSLQYISNQYLQNHVASKKQFWQALSKEYKRRRRLKKPQQQPLWIVFIEDLFEMVLAQPKDGFLFLEIAVYGVSLGIHFVAASSGVYRNLLHQLIQLHPTIEQRIIKGNKSSFTALSIPLGAELILSGEGIIFYKPQSAIEMEKLFPAV